MERELHFVAWTIGRRLALGTFYRSEWEIRFTRPFRRLVNARVAIEPDRAGANLTGNSGVWNSILDLIRPAGGEIWLFRNRIRQKTNLRTKLVNNRSRGCSTWNILTASPLKSNRRANRPCSTWNSFPQFGRVIREILGCAIHSAKLLSESLSASSFSTHQTHGTRHRSRQPERRRG